MRKPSRHPLITLFLVFAFMAQGTGLSGCSDVEKAYKEATGQTVADDSTVRAKLQTVNEMSDNAANQLIWMLEAANSAQTKGDAGDIKGMADAWINEVGPNAELLLSTIAQIEAAEQTIHEQTSAARTGSRPVSVEVAPAVSWAIYVIGAAALGYTFKQISDGMKEDRNKLESAAPGSAEEQAATKSIQERGAEAMKTMATAIVKFGVKTISTTAGAAWTIYDLGKKAVGKLRAIGGTKECSSELNQRRAGKMTNFSGSGCKIYVGEETSSGSSHTFENLPDGNWDMMTYASGLARTMYKGYTTYGTDSSVDKTFITIDEATAKNIKDSDAGTYSGDGSSGGCETSNIESCPEEIANPAPEGTVERFFVVGNDLAVSNGGTPPSFETTQTYWVTQLWTYHWNNGEGAPAGTIYLESFDGKTYGPWDATLYNGVYWVVYPNIYLPANYYTVYDSDPSTLAQNKESGGRGMAWGYGIPMGY